MRSFCFFRYCGMLWKRISDFLAHLFGKKKVEQHVMKYLIVGLGNMGGAYDDTRHNVGFKVIDFLAEENEVKFKHEHLGDLGSFKYKGRTFLLLKPSTFMNRSGKAVRYWLQKQKIPVDRMLIVVDDINLDFGKTRIRAKGSHGGHNGLRDIMDILGSGQFARLRIGVGSGFSKGRQVDYVLGKWTKEENSQLSEIIKHASKAVKSFGSIGLERTMSAFNK